MYFGHYFLFLVPVLAVLSGIGCTRLVGRLPARHRAFAAVGLALLLAATYWRETAQATLSIRSVLTGDETLPRAVFRFNAAQPSLWLRHSPQISLADWSLEAREVGRRLRDRLGPDDTIWVYDYEPSLYYFAGRRAPTRHFMNFEVTADLTTDYGRWLAEGNPRLVENRRVLMEDLAARPPRFVVRSRYACREPCNYEDGPKNRFGDHMTIWLWRAPAFPELQTFLDRNYREAPDLGTDALEVLELVPAPDRALR
jgi:hypothetical protein